MERIPVFPEFAPLQISHRQAIEGYYKENPPEVSELNFTEMFVWRKQRNTSLTDCDGNICVCLEKNGTTLFYPPLGKADKAAIVKKILGQAGPDTAFYGFTENEAQELSGAGFSVKSDPDNADYVYRSEDLIKLAGRKYDGKRNHLKKFLENYEFKFVEITPELIPELISFQRAWCEARACEDDLSLMHESRAVMEALENYPSLGVIGAAVLVKGKVQAFTIASELNADTAVVLFEKANPEYRGIYQFINREFCEKALSKYAWINREQDAGDPGLRRAKQSYNPARMVEKYIIRSGFK
ncbi:MAG TPA: phosphatidylglycerol lysyltransferase domain-containing protein [Candidatus Goldiibacteriota bacterium]|nr:phosphatidylglycerol lysyltransferase domain-containing protein [Candidatus Goldiibacteriota bacterium]